MGRYPRDSLARGCRCPCCTGSHTKQKIKIKACTKKLVNKKNRPCTIFVFFLPSVEDPPKPLRYRLRTSTERQRRSQYAQERMEKKKGNKERRILHDTERRNTKTGNTGHAHADARMQTRQQEAPPPRHCLILSRPRRRRGSRRTCPSHATQCPALGPASTSRRPARRRSTHS